MLPTALKQHSLLVCDTNYYAMSNVTAYHSGRPALRRPSTSLVTVILSLYG